MPKFNIDSVFSEYVLKAIQVTRNSILHPDNHTIFDCVTKNFASNTDAFLIDTIIQTLLNNNLLENRPANLDDSFFINHTSRDFHEVNCKTQTTPKL